MLDYARQRVREALRIPHRAVLATTGPAGLHASEVPCEAVELNLYLLLPRTSDHLFNLEHESAVTVVTSGWELKGHAKIVPSDTPGLELNSLREPGTEWFVLVQVDPSQLQVHRVGGWGNLETIDLQSL